MKKKFINKYSKRKNQIKIKNKLKLILIIIYIIFFFVIFNKIQKKLESNIYFDEYKHKIISLNISLKNISDLIKQKNKDNNRLFSHLNNNIKTNKNQINVCMSLDEKFIYPTLVSMTSALENNDKRKNIIIYHLILSYNFNTKLLEIFDSLTKKYEVFINYYIFPNLFNSYRTWVGSTHTIYYKIFIPIIFCDFRRMIYLDSDTLIYKDLYEMYNLPFNDNYILGYPFHDVYLIDKFVKNATTYINGGVLLFNIEKIRKDNKDIELIKFTFDYNKKLFFLEQDSINIIFFKKIGLLPLKYGIYLYGDINSFNEKVKKRLRINLNEKEVINAINEPSIVHFSCCSPKIWYKNSTNAFGVNKICNRFYNDFYYYANKTIYHSKIYEKYSNYNNI